MNPYSWSRGKSFTEISNVLSGKPKGDLRKRHVTSLEDPFIFIRQRVKRGSSFERLSYFYEGVDCRESPEPLCVAITRSKRFRPEMPVSHDFAI